MRMSGSAVDLSASDLSGSLSCTHLRTHGPLCALRAVSTLVL